VADATPREIGAKKILAVEGRDEVSFFEELISHLGVKDVQIEDVGGKDQFSKRLPALLKTPGFFGPDNVSIVTHLAVVRDKDEDNAFASIVNVIRSANLKPPTKQGRFSDSKPKVGVFIMPGQNIKGTMLEDLCLKTVERHALMGCVDEFISCACLLEDKPKNLSKAKVHAFLAGQPEIVNSVGLAAKKRYWDFESRALNELKAFLETLK
jgi:hypothetical protein